MADIKLWDARSNVVYCMRLSELFIDGAAARLRAGDQLIVRLQLPGGQALEACVPIVAEPTLAPPPAVYGLITRHADGEQQEYATAQSRFHSAIRLRPFHGLWKLRRSVHLAHRQVGVLVSSPPTTAFSGSRLGPTLLVLTRPEIRECEELTAQQRFSTRDGIVVGRAGDIAITAYGGERYPISREVFLGAYAIMARVGTEIAAKRLIHVRRAWEVLDDGASFDYSHERGRVPVARGSWLYQSDADDFGTTHVDVKHHGHVEAGLERELNDIDWTRRCDSWLSALGILPAVLSLLALGAFFASVSAAPHWMAPALIAVEVLLLAGGVTTAVAIRRQRWLLKACVQTALALGREFNAAARLLGQPASMHFSGMALWRAAQSPHTEPPSDAHELLETVKLSIAKRSHWLKEAIERIHRREASAGWVTAAAVTAVLLSNLFLLLIGHSLAAEFAVIWLPVLVSTVHGFDLRGRSRERLAAMQTFADELHFVQTRLFEAESSSDTARAAVLVVLCRAAAQYGQHELQLALATEAPLPI